MKKRLLIILSIVSTLALFTACSTDASSSTVSAAAPSAAAPAAASSSAPAGSSTAKGGDITVALCQLGSENNWRITETKSIQDEAAARGYQLIYTNAEGDTAKQISDMEDIIEQKPDVILLAPREYEGLTTALDAAKEVGIPVVLIDRDCKGEAGVDYETLIAADFEWEGRTAAQALVEKFGTENPVNVVQITGTPDSSPAISRQKGFEDEIAKYDNFTIVATQNGDFQRAMAQSVMENIIQAQGDAIDAVYGHDDECAIGAIQALKTAGVEVGGENGVQVVGIGGFKDAAVSIQNGEMLATVLCSPFFGPVAMDTVEKIVAGESVETFIQNPGYIVNAENVEEYMPKSF